MARINCSITPNRQRPCFTSFCIIITTGRVCRWYALAPLGPFISRAYRLIEFSFACVWCPTTADAVRYAPKAPSDEGRFPR